MNVGRPKPVGKNNDLVTLIKSNIFTHKDAYGYLQCTYCNINLGLQAVINTIICYMQNCINISII